MHHHIDARLKESCKLIEVRRNALESQLEITSKSLESHRIDRGNLTECMKNLTNSISNPALSIDDKKIIHQVMGIFSDLLVKQMDSSTSEIALLSRSVQKELEAVDRIKSFTFSLDNE